MKCSLLSFIGLLVCLVGVGFLWQGYSSDDQEIMIAVGIVVVVGGLLLFSDAAPDAPQSVSRQFEVVRPYAQVEADCSEAIRRGAEDAGIYVARGSARFNLGRYVEAEADYSEAIRRGVADDTVFALRGVARLIAALDDQNFVAFETTALPNFLPDFLQKVDLQGANLQGANLQGADLQKICLQGANLQGANLRAANLRGTDLQDVNLRGASLQGANLRGCNLYGADLLNAELRQVAFAESILPNGAGWTRYTEMERFTDPDHPLFWRSDDPESPAYQWDGSG